MGVDLLWTFISCHVQLLQQQGMAMWMYLGLGCPDRSFSAELDDTEINAQIQGILVHGANQNSGPSLVPLREGVISPWVSLVKLIFV
jgi:hypothetical protein